MAEVVLGVVSSGFAVVSLAIQLVEVLQKVHSFWDSIDDSSQNIQHIRDYLCLLASTSDSIIKICEREPNIASEAVLRSLNSCMKSVKLLERLLGAHQNTQSRSAMKRGWATLKVTLKERTIDKIESRLKGDITMLLLSLQPFFHHAHNYQITTLTSNEHLLSTAHSKGPTESVILDDVELSACKDLLLGKTLIMPASKASRRNSRLVFSRLQSHRRSFKFDSYTAIEKIVSRLGLSIPPSWRSLFNFFKIIYISTNYQLNLHPEESLRKDIKRTMKILLPIFSFQLQASNLPWTLVSHPIVPCQSQIFNLCLQGNVEAVRVFIYKSWVSPFVVNQHGENLLHAAARYAHANLCCFLLDIGVHGSAYDDQLLTPLDHLARKVCPTFQYPARVVDTFRALIERGKCQPLLPLTSNAICFYRGPEEGFAWLFSAEYAGVNLEEPDSEGWTLLGDAAFNFGWWTDLGTEDPAIGWQALYLLRAGADPHGKSCEAGLTPLDTFLRGCTVHGVDNAGKWLQVIAKCGVNLHTYAKEEEKIHSSGHYLRSTWDEELWRWTPTKRLVLYEYGQSANHVEIWLEDYDALSWFGCGRYDLEIFLIGSPAQGLERWKALNAESDLMELNEAINKAEPRQPTKVSRLKSFNDFLQSGWFRFVIITLFLNYALHLILIFL